MKKLKLYIAILFVTMAAICPVLAEDVTTETIKEHPAVESTAPLPRKVPTSKKALAYKFIMAMLGVGASSIIIYVLLTIYNRFIYGTPTRIADTSKDDEFFIQELKIYY